jgi:cytochrome P450
MDCAVSVIESILQNPVQLWATLSVLVLLTYKTAHFFLDRKRNPSRLPLPPGPKGYPIIGNVLNMPAKHQWRTYAEWAKVYGDVFSFEVLGQRIMVLNSLEVAQDLFEKRSANYSDRPRMPMMLELMDFGHIFGLLPYGQWWRRHRRSFNEHFHANAVCKYHPVQARETRAFLNKLLQAPERLIPHIRETLASRILSIAYGIKIKGFDDPYIVKIEESLKGFNLAGVPGSFLVDLIPALKHVPSWFPGAGFKKKAAYWAQVNRDVAERPFNHVVQQVKEGIAGPSLAATLITALPEGDKDLLAEETSLAQNTAAVAYLGAADTTFSAIQTFFLAMAIYPEVQRRAQAEIDAVIGAERLPEFIDRPSLPYVNALVKETMRWQVVLPLAFAHMATDDDVYQGYFIPKGTIILGNAW